MTEYTGAKPMKDPKSYLSDEEIKGLIDAAENYRDRLLLTFLSRTGRRVSEVVRSLRVKDIDFTKNLVNFRTLKRHSPTYSLLPIPRELLDELKEYIKVNNLGKNDFLWPISRQRVDQIIKKCAEKAGMSEVGNNKYNRVHAHLFRHSYAIRGAMKASSPADITQLRDMLGHSRIDTTMFYLKFNPEEKRKLLEKMWEE